ncbi:MAG: metal-dependent transcriptional regulator [Caldilineaceae bacterium]
MAKANEKSKLNDKQKLLTSAHEDYVKAIYSLEARGVEVNNSALAAELNISPASTTNMVKKLDELGLVTYTPYQSITLTESGQKVALEVLRHHRLIELYLHERLNLPWEQIHEEAEKLEHVLSDALEDAMSAALGNPTIDPHGDPIPTKEGYIEPSVGISLTRAQPNHPYRLVRVLMQDAERLSYLGSLGLYPGSQVMLLKQSPFAGPLIIEVAGEHHALAHEMAEKLLVAEVNDATMN